MNLVELHILQSFPVTCLNRDDVGAPKSAYFGGCQRARVSSQSWKRAIRTMAKTTDGSAFGGERTRFVVNALRDGYESKGQSAEAADVLAKATADALGKLDDKSDDRVKTLLYFSPGELDLVVGELLALDCDEPVQKILLAEDTKEKDAKVAAGVLGKLAAKAVKKLAGSVKDAADISIFGRMVADDHTLMVEGAGLFSHALSTHAVANEIDFFSAVDDNNTADESAGHIGTLEFNSACYYRYVGLNLDMLSDDAHLGHFSGEELDGVLDAFLRAAVLAVPQARKNSMFGHNPPSYMLGLRREGQPLSLVNAFESAVRANGAGYVENSTAKLEQHWETLKSVYGLVATEIKLPPTNLDDLLSGLTKCEV